MDPIETGTNQNKQENQHPNEPKMYNPLCTNERFNRVNYGKGKQIKTWMCVTKGIDLN